MNFIITDRSTGCFIIGPRNISKKINDEFLVKLSKQSKLNWYQSRLYDGKYYARFHVKHEDASDSYLRKAYEIWTFILWHM